MDLRLAETVVLVTGSSSGIGKATAQAFLDEGARVVVTGIAAAEVEQATRDLAASGDGRVHGVVADLGTADGAAALWRFAEALGPVGTLVNNVGAFAVQDFAETDDATWQRYWDVNLMTAVRLNRLALPAMLGRGAGSIVHVASEVAVKPVPWMLPYATAKAGLVALSRGLAELAKGSAVRINAVLPGPTRTAAVEAYFAALATTRHRPVADVLGDYFRDSEPTSLLQRLLEPEEVARGIVMVAANPAMRGGAHRIEGGIIRSAF